MREGTQNAPSVLRPADDPEGWSRLVAGTWRVTEKLELGRRSADGTVVPCSHVIFTPGDFVDVAVAVDISYKGRSGVSVQLSMIQIVQMTPASETGVVSRSLQLVIAQQTYSFAPNKDSTGVHRASDILCRDQWRARVTSSYPNRDKHPNRRMIWRSNLK